MKGGAVRSRNKVSNKLFDLKRAVKILKIKEVLAWDYRGPMITGKGVKKHKVKMKLFAAFILTS
jgi:hypothetical protein